MVEIGRAIISRDILEKDFLCDLQKCKGACCIEGDSGAPVTPEEVILIEKIYPQLKKYLPEKHLNTINSMGFAVIDSDGDLVTTLVDNRQCVYSFFNDQGILTCSIEKAFNDKMTNFRKPLSCHLFPVRITEYKRFDAVNYEKLKICKSAIACGKANHMPLYVFLKYPLIRKYGEEWYKELEIAAQYLRSKES